MPHMLRRRVDMSGDVSISSGHVFSHILPKLGQVVKSPALTKMVGNYCAWYINESRSLRDKDEFSKCRLSSRPQTGIRWLPVLGPRTRFFARSRRAPPPSMATLTALVPPYLVETPKHIEVLRLFVLSLLEIRAAAAAAAISAC